MDGAPPLQESSIRAHEQTVRLLAASVDAILPARFGSVIGDENALAQLLENREVELQRALELVQGREQMTLRVYRESAPAQTMAAEEHSMLGPGARYLAGKIQEREAGIAEFEAVRPELAPFIKVERIQHHSTPPLLASIYHLIERGRSADYVAALNRAVSGPQPARITASGPWPPYAFARWEGL